MKKLIAMLCALLLVAAPALADLPLPEMATEDLFALRDAISLELASRSASADALAGWESEKALIELLSITRGTSKDGVPAVSLLFSYTNKLQDVSNFRKSHWVKLYHDGVECTSSIYFNDALAGTTDTWSINVLPGRTFDSMQWVFELHGTEDTVDIQIVDYDSPSKSIGFCTVALPAE